MPSDSYERLSTQDSSFITFEGPGTHMHVSAVSVFESGPLADAAGRLDIDRLRSYVDSRLHLLPRYRQRLDFTPLQRHPIWVDDHSFNLHYHVRHTALPGPGSERQLKDLAGRIMSQQLDREKPLWEMWFIEGLEDQRFALISKIHHCMVDGASGVSVLTALLSHSTEEEVDPTPRWNPRPAPGRLELAADELARRAATPISALRAVAGAFRKPQEASASLARGADAMWQALNAGLRLPSNTPLNAPIGTHRRIDWCTLDLAEVRDLKKRVDCTVNDVVLTVITGAVRRYLKHRRVALGGLDFRIVVPVNMRSAAASSASGNQVSAWFISLPIAERDPLLQLEKIKAETERLRHSRAAQGIELFTRITEWTGSDLLASWGVRLASTLRPYNLIVTNVPGPQVPLYMLGARLEAMYPQLPLFEHQGLGTAILSYAGKVGFGLIGDWDLVPDLAQVTRAIEASFADLQEAVAAR